MTSRRLRLSELGGQVGEHLPGGRYASTQRGGGLLFVSGHTSRESPHPQQMREGAFDVEAARGSARLAAVNLLAAVENDVGLERVSTALHLRGYVRAPESFGDHPRVLDAASEVFLHVLTPGGVHARTAIGVASLPSQALVELECVLLLT